MKRKNWVTIPLVIKKGNCGEFRLEPLERKGDVREYAVVFKFNKTIAVTETLLATVKNIENLMLNEAKILAKCITEEEDFKKK